MFSRLWGRLLTSPLAFLLAGIADFVLYASTLSTRRIQAAAGRRRGRLS